MQMASCSSDQPELELLQPPSSSVKDDTDPDDGLVVEASGSTKDHDRDSAMGFSEDDVDWDDDESGPESTAGDDYLTCLDTEEAIVKSTHKKVQASCSPTKQGLWRDAQLEQNGSSHQVAWGSDHEAVRTEWDLALDKDHSSFEVGGMMV